MESRTYKRGLSRLLRTSLNGPQMLAFLPALCLAGYWGGGEVLLVTIALGTPLIYAVTGGFGQPFHAHEMAKVPAPDLASVAQDFLEIAQHNGQTTACLKIEIHGLAELANRFGPSATNDARELIRSRLATTLRSGDHVFQTGDTCLTVLISPGFRLKLDTLLDVAKRLRTVAEPPLSVAGSSQYVSVYIGIASSLNFGRNVTADTWLRSASEALIEATETGSGATRVWSEKLSRKHHAKRNLQTGVAAAFEDGRIQAHFQPQVSVTTNDVTGMEVLARWDHPTQGMLAPSVFLNAIEDSQQMSRLGKTIRTQSIAALQAWDDMGYDVPTISLNLSGQELRDPNFAEHVQAELDRSMLLAHRLVFEVPERLFVNLKDDIVRRNLSALVALGCTLDIDGYGVGGSDIAMLQKIAVNRIKIDQSLIRGVDTSCERHRVFHAILDMCKRLEIQAVGTGVETVGEHGVLRELGCQVAQGFLFAEPASAVDMSLWLADQQQQNDLPANPGLRRVK